MSDQTPPTQPSEESAAQPGSSQRTASVRFETAQAPVEKGLGLDAANQSLMDALKITFRFLQVGMVVIVALYFLSGFQSIEEGERGIRIQFGSVVGNDLEPGFRPAWPYPIGELVKIRRAAAPLDEQRAFWPRPNDDGSPRTIDRLASSPSLTPGRDGSLITADKNVAHTRWRVTYYREDPALYAQNVHPDHEERLVNHAVRSAVVTTVAGRTIDELLKDTERNDGTTVAIRARQLTQAKLDSMSTGLRIETMELLDKIPPKRLIEDFDGVQSAEASANERITSAENIARLQLTRAAGRAAEALVERIDEYGSQIELGEAGLAAETLSEIHALLQGDYENAGQLAQGVQVSGEVTRILNQANQDAATIVNQRRGELANFEALAAQFEANPLVTVQNAWAKRFAEFLAQPNVVTFTLPSGQPFELFLNSDPEINKEIERSRNQRESDEAMEQRRRELQEGNFRSDG
ncbi:MAG: SPFH domain-containing protein [Planctomycetota bacterium]